MNYGFTLDTSRQVDSTNQVIYIDTVVEIPISNNHDQKLEH